MNRFSSSSELLRALREEQGLTQKQAACLLGVSLRTYRRMEQENRDDDNDEDNVDVNDDLIKSAFAVIRGVGEMGKLAPIQILDSLGLLDELYAAPLPRTLPNASPLVKYPIQNEYITQAIEDAVKGRRLYCYEGNIEQTLVRYKDALAAAKSGDALALVAYIKTFAGEIHVSRGNYVEAREKLAEARKHAQDILEFAQAESNTDLARAAGIIDLRARIFLLQADVDQRVSSDSISQLASNMESALEMEAYFLSDYFSIPSIHRLLANHAMRNGFVQKAKIEIDKAIALSFLYAAPRNTQTALFLDYSGVRDQLWYIDQQRLAKVKILVDSGDMGDAISVLDELHGARKVEARKIITAKFGNVLERGFEGTGEDISGRAELADMTALSPVEKLRHWLWDWVDPRLAPQALWTVALAERDEGKLDSATAHLEQAIDLTRRKGPAFIYVSAGIECGLIYAQQAKQSLALEKLNMIQEKLQEISNPYLTEEFQKAWEAVAKLG